MAASAQSALAVVLIIVTTLTKQFLLLPGDVGELSALFKKHSLNITSLGQGQARPDG